MLRLLLFISALILLQPTHGKDDYRYRNITMDHGLAANSVRNIVQDADGFIWFGTDNGLCRYDGIRIVGYPIAELGHHTYISALAAVDDGLYAGTDKGVYWLSRRPGGGQAAFERLPLDIHSVVTRLATDADGRLWVSTMADGVWRYDPRTRQAQAYPLSGGQKAVAQVLVDNDGQVWTITNWSHPPIQRLNPRTGRFEPVSLDYAGSPAGLAMLQTRDGQMWVGSWEDGLLLMHRDGRLERLTDPRQPKAGLHIHTLYQRPDGDICIGCDDGLLCLDPETKAWKPLIGHRHTPTDWQQPRFVYAVTADTEGGLWVGTFYGGVHYVSPAAQRPEAFATEMAGHVVSRLREDTRGRLWVASDDGGLACYDPQRRQFADYPHRDQLARQNAHALTFCGDELWVGTYTSGILVLDTATGSLAQHTQTDDPASLDNPSCYALHTDRRGTVWVGTMNGMSRYDRTRNAFETVITTGATVIGIDEDQQGQLWVATQGSGLWRYDPKRKQATQYLHHDGDKHTLPDDQVNGTLVDTRGRLWVATFGGLCRYDPASGHFEQAALDLPTRNVTALAEDHGALWLSTDRGIVRYTPPQATAPAAPAQAQRFTQHDGLASEQFQPDAVLKASDGRIYFGSTSGFTAFLPRQIKANDVRPPVYITSLDIPDARRRADSHLPTDLSHTAQVEISHADARLLTFSFASLSYCSPQKNQYAYKLDGHDTDWTYAANQPQATYTNLPSGTYTLHVKATNNDGVWSSAEATLRLVVRPPLWWTWYAKLSYLLAAIALVVLARRRLAPASPAPTPETTPETPPAPADDDFLLRLNKTIEENLANSELNVNFLAAQLNVSRSGLFAKVKSLADTTPNEMIQTVRLKKAAQLLQQKKYTVSEISYMVGFSSPSYFAKCFQKQFGTKPTDYHAAT